MIHVGDERPGMPLINEIRLDDADQLIDALDPKNSRWSARIRIWSRWIFRGVGDAGYKLLPSAFRGTGHERLRNLADSELQGAYGKLTADPSRINPHWRKGSRWESEFKDFIMQVGAEFEAVRYFAELADSLGLHVEEPPTGETVIRRFAENHLSADPVFIDQHYVSPTMAIAQHHGIPTRLLDWTRQPIYALWFAAHSALKNSRREPGVEQMAIWALDTKGFENSECPLQVITVPSHRDQYINAQHGVFLLDTSANRDRGYKGHWKGVDERLKPLVGKWVDLNPEPLVKFTAPTKLANEILEKLAVAGIHEAKLQPTFDKVAREAQARWLGY